MRKAYKDLISDLYYEISLLKNPPKFKEGDNVEVLFCPAGSEIEPRKGVIKGLAEIHTRPVCLTYLGISKYVATPVYSVDVGDNIWEVQQWRLR